jgi:nitroreductase
VLDLARRTPSWCNTQPWHVLVAEGEGTEKFRAALSAQTAAAELTPDFAFPPSYSGPYLQRRRECGFQLYDWVRFRRRLSLPTRRSSASSSGCRTTA